MLALLTKERRLISNDSGKVRAVGNPFFGADRVRAIYIVCNPDKLRHLAA